MTIVMAPFMSCGARLPVFVLFAAAFFPQGGQNVVFGLYLIGIAVAVLTGLMLKNSVLRGEATPFIMELPPYHADGQGVLLHTWDRLKAFVIRAGRVIVPMVLVLNVLNAIGTDGSFGNEDTDKSVLAEVGRTIAPAFGPMGLTEENWPAAVGIFTGVLAKEAVVGTLDATYTALAEQDAQEAGAAKEEEEPFNLGNAVAEAFATIPTNLPMRWAAGRIRCISPRWTSARMWPEEQKVHSGTFGAMASRFDGTAGAFAYLLFILLYMPCAAAIAAVYQESGLRWTLFVGAWTTGLGYGLATLFYQAARWDAHPSTAAAWIAAVLVAFAAWFATMRWMGRRADDVAMGPAASAAGGAE